MDVETKEPAPGSQPGLRHPAWLLGAALFLGWLADLLFYGERLGLSVPLFAGAQVAVLFALAQREGLRPARHNLWLLLPLGFFAAMAFVRADPILTFFNVVLCLLLLGDLAYFFAQTRTAHLNLRAFFVAPLLATGYAVVRPARLLGAGLGLRAPGQDGRRHLAPVARGLLLALPVLVVFGLLLASADLVFAQLLKDLLSFKIPPLLLDLLLQAVVTLAAAWLVAGGLAYTLERKQGLRTVELSQPRPPLFRLGFVETATFLCAVNGLFFVFVWIQFTYLFGGEQNVVAAGYTYARYARRGFLDLLAVSVMTLGLLLTLQRAVRLASERQQRAFGLLGSALVALVLLILASAFQRLSLYEEAYGFTRLRLYSHVFMVWLGLLLLWLAATRWSPRLRFGIGAFAAFLGFFVTLNVLNPDAFIARQNLARYEATGKLDVRYLTWLSDDAVPDLRSIAGRLRGHDAFLLRQHLRQRRDALQALGAETGWPSYHLQRARARRLLEQAD